MNHEVQNFETQVLQRSKEVAVLVDFWAPWCGPCRALGPVLERMAAQANGKWELCKVNTDEQPDLAQAFNISSIPAVKLFVDGKVVDEFVGALPEPQIRRFLEKALPSPAASQVAEAQRLLTEGRHAEAAVLLESVLSAAPEDSEVRVQLAHASLFSAPDRTLSLLEKPGLDPELSDKVDALRTLARVSLFASQPQSLPEGKVRDRYLAGASALRSGDFASALEAFIEVLTLDRQYDQEGGKKACRAIFQLLGRQHPLAERYFRAFSSALLS